MRWGLTDLRVWFMLGVVVAGLLGGLLVIGGSFVDDLLVVGLLLVDFPFGCFCGLQKLETMFLFGGGGGAENSISRYIWRE